MPRKTKNWISAATLPNSGSGKRNTGIIRRRTQRAAKIVPGHIRKDHRQSGNGTAPEEMARDNWRDIPDQLKLETLAAFRGRIKRKDDDQLFN